MKLTWHNEWNDGIGKVVLLYGRKYALVYRPIYDCVLIVRNKTPLAMAVIEKSGIRFTQDNQVWINRVGELVLGDKPDPSFDIPEKLIKLGIQYFKIRRLL
jgi:hypothetical protein